MDNYIPLSVPSFQGKEKEYVTEAIVSEWVSTGGAFVSKFEEKFSSFIGADHGVATMNGTAALHTALLECRVGPGDEVIVPTVTFISPINVVRYTGAEPVFMDCDDFLNLDTEKVVCFLTHECEEKEDYLINKGTKKRIKAIIPVHVFGHPVRLEGLLELCRKYNIAIIEDATESLGSYYTKGDLKGKMTGRIGNIGCFSFNGNKIITTGGGGMIVCEDKVSINHMKYLTTQAKDDEIYFIHHEIGYNYRMTNLQAALGLAQLELLDCYIQIKRKNFEKYKRALSGFKGLTFIEEPDYSYSNYWFYSLVVEKEKYGLSRDELVKKLDENRIQARPLWYLNHRQVPYQTCQAYQIEKAYYYYDRIINIPCSVGLKEGEIEKVIQVIKG